MARILVIDDEPDMRMALGNVLNRAGHQVFESGDGPGALDFLAREGAELVLLDMRLPGMDGPQILRSLRERDKNTPVVMVTGYGSVDSAVEVMRLGASHYLSKPFSNQELLETVERVLKGGAAVPAPVPVRRLSEPVPERPPALVEPIGAEPSGRGLWTGLALAAAGALAFGLWGSGGDVQGRDYKLSHEHPTALLWTGERLWVADWVSQSIYEYRVSGEKLEPLRSVHLPDSNVTALAVAKDRLWVADAARRVIEERRLDAALSVTRSHPAPGTRPSGLFWDGRYLWSADSAAGRIFRHETEAGLAVLESFKAPGKSPAALQKDESYLWSADSESRRLYRHRLDKTLSVLSAYALPELDRGPQPLSALTIKDGEVWFARDGRASVYVRPLEAFAEKTQGEARP
ncbi:MAG: response regulator [Elusimicrobia bacterium]|nr:response regulator [Elusimicrobiota bacterium]